MRRSFETLLQPCYRALTLVALAEVVYRQSRSLIHKQTTNSSSGRECGGVLIEVLGSLRLILVEATEAIAYMI